MKGSFGGSGKIGPESALARGSPAGAGVVVPEVREGASGVNHPVNPVPAGSFPAIPGLGGGSSGCGLTEPNMAVKSPTFFLGGSCGREGDGDKAGISDGRSPRNGPWKKLVNSPGLGLLTGGGPGSAGRFLAVKSGRKGPEGRLISGVGLGGTEIRGVSGSLSGLQGGPVRREDWSAAGLIL